MKTTRKTITSLLFAALALLGGCVHAVRFEPLGNAGVEIGSPKDPKGVEIFVTTRPDYKYVELGTLSYNSGSMATDMKGVYEKFRERAAQLGADGVIMLATGTSIASTGAGVTYDYWGNPLLIDTPVTHTIHWGIAIRKTE